MESTSLEKDFKAIVVLLATQAMIHLGEIADPLAGEKRSDPRRVEFFIGLLEILQNKTKGNLSGPEQTFLAEVLSNLRLLAKKKG